MSKFDPRAIPGRAHYDRLTTWAVGVFSRLHPHDLADLQAALTEDSKAAISGDDDNMKVAAVLAEIGFCAVLDSMADSIEQAEGGR